MKLEKLTKEQEYFLLPFKNKFIEDALSFKEINISLAIDAIKLCYSFIKKDMPKIHKTISPMASQILANKLCGTNNKVYEFSSYLSIRWASFYAYYDVFVEFGIITRETNANYFELRKIIESGVYDAIEFENAIILCERPFTLHRNGQGQMHNINGAAIEWRDGYSQHYINGRYISETNFNLIKEKKYTIEMFFSEKNEEVKSVCLQCIIEMHGDSYLANLFSSILKEVDTFVNKKEEQFMKGTTGGMNVGVYTLFNGEFNNYKIAYVRCYCPSTDRMFYLGVEPVYDNAKDAIASLYTVPAVLKKHIKEIRRQGERFSTTFDDNGISLLKNKKLTEKDLNNLVSISGNEYFSKITYEF